MSGILVEDRYVTIFQFSISIPEWQVIINITRTDTVESGFLVKLRIILDRVTENLNPFAVI
jgi:hypothetical protein